MLSGTGRFSGSSIFAAGDNNLELLKATGRVAWEDIDHNSPIFTRSEVTNHMVKMHKLTSKYSAAYSAAKRNATR